MHSTSDQNCHFLVAHCWFIVNSNVSGPIRLGFFCCCNCMELHFFVHIKLQSSCTALSQFEGSRRGQVISSWKRGKFLKLNIYSGRRPNASMAEWLSRRTLNQLAQVRFPVDTYWTFFLFSLFSSWSNNIFIVFLFISKSNDISK